MALIMLLLGLTPEGEKPQSAPTKAEKEPKKLVNVLRCANPRCITSTEQELEQVFFLSDEETGTYRCKYCEAETR
jgi:aspartate carbamoyltransferase regulatory subunit